MRLRRATAPDMEQVRAIYAGPAKEHIFDMPDDAKWWVVEDRGQVVAFASARLLDDEVRLTSAWTEPAYRGMGLQTRLIRARVKWARKCRMSRVVTYTWGGNLPSIRALIRCGFVPVRREWDGERSWMHWSKELA